MKSIVMHDEGKVRVIYTTKKPNVYDITTIDPEAASIENMVVEEKKIPGRVIDDFVKSKNKLTWEREQSWRYALELSEDKTFTEDHKRDYEWGANLINMLLVTRDSLKESNNFREANESYKAQIANYISSYRFIEAIKNIDGNEFT